MSDMAAAARGTPAPTAFRVLVVDDDPDMAAFFARMLAKEGMRADTLHDGAAALRQVMASPPDLVLLDVMLPDADGFDILMRMRQHPVLKRVPVVMLTGKATRQAVIKGLAAGADGYLTKPFEPDAVMRAVRTVLGVEEQAAAAEPANDPWVNGDAKLQRVARAPSTRR